MNPFKAILGLGCAATTVAVICSDPEKADKACLIGGYGCICAGTLLIASSGNSEMTETVKKFTNKILEGKILRLESR